MGKEKNDREQIEVGTETINPNIDRERRTVKVQTKNLSLYYDEFQALKDVSMDIESNKVTAFIGPSGCGKSTFLKTLDRMNDLISYARIEGKVYYDGIDIYREFDVTELRKKIGMVFQKPNPFQMSVYDNIAYGPRVHGVKKRSVLDALVEKSLKQAALWEEVNDRLHESAIGLSGGQQQRLCIARVLAVEPDVILMDEPTSALDPISTAKIEDLIYKLKEDFTIIIVTHNMQQAGRISDATAFFLVGEVVEFGPTDEVFLNPRDGRTEDYISGRFG
jgi:phosphate transport system ATP-binding protein